MHSTPSVRLVINAEFPAAIAPGVPPASFRIHPGKVREISAGSAQVLPVMMELIFWVPAHHEKAPNVRTFRLSIRQKTVSCSNRFTPLICGLSAQSVPTLTAKNANLCFSWARLEYGGLSS
jgi:hypothetical protein